MEDSVAYSLAGEVRYSCPLEFLDPSFYLHHLESRVIGCLTDQKYSLSIAADTDKHYKPPSSSSTPQDLTSDSSHEGLNLLSSLSIGGNDLLGSSLYTSGIVASYAGKVHLPLLSR